MNPENFDNDRIEQAGQLAADFIQDVDFPGFVRDLIHGVFRANIEVMHEQTNDFIRIMKMATQSLAQFVNKIDDTSTFAYLVDKEPDKFSFQLPPIPDDDEEAAAQPQQPVLTDKQGQPLDLGDNMVKAKIMDAKIAMAQEQRALLREVLLMGITRLVVEEGNINAAVVFDIKAKENIVRTGQQVNERVTTSGGNFGGSFFGLFGGGRSSTERKTEITVSSAKGTANTELAAENHWLGFHQIQDRLLQTRQFRANVWPCYGAINSFSSGPRARCIATRRRSAIGKLHRREATSHGTRSFAI